MDLKKYHRILTAHRRALPDFFIIGAAKAGTTSLYHYLNRHPNIAGSHPRKEVDYFTGFKWSLSWYRSNFPVRKPDTRYFEASTNYIYYPLAPIRIRELLPESRFIALLRNPVERAYSHYHHNRKIGVEKLDSFAGAVERELEWEKNMGQDDDARALDKSYFSLTYLDRSKYLPQIKRWHRYFPKDRLRIFSSDDFFTDIQAILDEIHEFLGVSRFDLEDRKVHNPGVYEEPLDAGTRKFLEEYFKPYNFELYEYLERDFEWDASRGAESGG